MAHTEGNVTDRSYRRKGSLVWPGEAIDFFFFFKEDRVRKEMLRNGNLPERKDQTR